MALEQLMALPFGTQLLADLGAEVVAVEQIDSAKYDTPQPWRLRTGRNKSRIVVDIAKERGQALIKQLAATADAVVENYRPGVMDNHGLGWQHLRRVNPRLVYLSVSGFGHEDVLPSPDRAMAGYGPIAEARSGITATLLSLGGKGSTGLALGDITTALFAMIGLLTAIRHRDRTGEGQYVDISMADCLFSLAELPFARAMLSSPGERAGTPAGGILDGVFRARDGRRFYLICINDRHWLELANIVERSQWAAAPWWGKPEARQLVMESEIRTAVQEWSSGQTLEDAVSTVRARGLAATPILEPADALTDPHFAAREMVATVEAPDGRLHKIPGNPIKLSALTDDERIGAGRTYRIAAAGDDSFAVLSKVLGLSDRELTDLAREGVIVDTAGTDSANRAP